MASSDHVSGNLVENRNINAVDYEDTPNFHGSILADLTEDEAMS
jgi:hypothetical protein